MSRLMIILGIVFLALGAAIAVVGIANPGQMQIRGLSMDSAGLLLMTGMISMGLGGVIDAVMNRGGTRTVAMTDEVAAEPVVVATIETPAAVIVEEALAPATAEAEQPSRIRFRGFGRKSGADAASASASATAGAATTIVAATVSDSGRSSVDDTINALEKAKQDIANALGGVERITASPPPVVSEPEPAGIEEAVVEEEAAADDGELYVVEEKIIRGRPARILSDDTVEAETEEGWMRFENIEHLNEYLDAAEA